MESPGEGVSTLNSHWLRQIAAQSLGRIIKSWDEGCLQVLPPTAETLAGEMQLQIQIRLCKTKVAQRATQYPAWSALVWGVSVDGVGSSIWLTIGLETLCGGSVTHPKRR